MVDPWATGTGCLGRAQQSDDLTVLAADDHDRRGLLSLQVTANYPVYTLHAA